jgi:phosphocarrier protein
MAAAAKPTTEETFEIVNELGMHARAATKFVQTANRYKSEIAVEKDGQVVNGKSIMGVLMLVASKGSFVKIRATGEDSTGALEALGKLIRDKFGEE